MVSGSGFRYILQIQIILPNRFTYLLTVVLLLAACTKTPKTKTIEGNYVNKTWLDESEKIKNARPSNYFIFSELTFTKDSALIINGQLESFRVPYKQKDSIIKIYYGNEKDQVWKFLHKDNILTLLDLETKQEFVPGDSNLIRIDSFFKLPLSFTPMINRRVIAGNYFDYLDSTFITFSESGEITGLNNYTFFRLCQNGDCANFSEKPLISLLNSKGYEEFIYTFYQDTLVLYSVKQVNAPEDIPFYIPEKEFKRLVLKSKEN